MSRPPASIAAFVFVAAFLCAGCAGDEGISAVRTPELKEVPAIMEPGRQSSKASGSSIREDISAMPDLKVGSFERPDPAQVPEYEILDRTPSDRDGAHAVRLLVDSRSRTQKDFEIIARDLKARFAGYDAISVEFTDTHDVLAYTGAALIYNTPAGVYYMGFVYGPPSPKGYYVRAAE
ncbi:MAG: hypothetical protein H0V83_03685 [Rubrobacter sp.]|nr:hypothetical protein [Rubrobacter sp.]